LEVDKSSTNKSLPIEEERQKVLDLKHEIQLRVIKESRIKVPEKPLVYYRGGRYFLEYPNQGICHTQNSIGDFAIPKYITSGILTKEGYQYLADSINKYHRFYTILLSLTQLCAFNAIMESANNSTFLQAKKNILEKNTRISNNFESTVVELLKQLLADVCEFVNNDLVALRSIKSFFNNNLNSGLENLLNKTLDEFTDTGDGKYIKKISGGKTKRIFTKLFEPIEIDGEIIKYKRKPEFKYSLFDATILLNLIDTLVDELGQELQEFAKINKEETSNMDNAKKILNTIIEEEMKVENHKF